ncbi:carbohydrate binding family 9 domain-containing protein, partial [Draconibacterium sp.]|nr:carbohydrate binding family 9 domain-containing protein [Draconibacterium sp.]
MRITSVLLLLLTFQPGISQDIEKKNYSAQKVDNIDITIDGKLEELEWKTAIWENQFIQYEPTEGKPPHMQTEYAVLYDENNIYVAIKALDNSPDSISLRMTRRDITDGDLAGIMFDTYHDKRTSFNFFVSAAGVKSDFVMSNDGDNEDETWDPIWWVKTAVTKEGWNAEMRIPLTQLRFEEGEEQLWGWQVLRYIFRKDELSAWQPMEREKSGFVSQYGTMNGIKNIKPKNTLSVTPYAVARMERFEKEPEDPFRSSGKINDLNVGLDAKIGLTNYLTMDLTINPDFGQVEADPSEVNLTTYETFFEEKRPFFIEGKNILSYGLSFGDGDLAANNLFYSRRIGHRPHYSPDLDENEYADVPEFTSIIGAAKVTGKTKNGWSVGVLESVTAEENAEIKGIGEGYSQSVEPLTNFFVGRLQKDFNEGNTYVGGIVTAVNRNINDEHLEFLHKSAYSGGLDFVHKWNDKNWLLDVGFYASQVNGSEEALIRTQEAYSRTYQRPDADYVSLDSSRTSLSGHGGKFTIGKVGGKFKIAAIFNWKSPGLEINDIGFSPEVDEAMQILWAGYRWYEPFSIFRSANLNINQWTVYDFGG